MNKIQVFITIETDEKIHLFGSEQRDLRSSTLGEKILELQEHFDECIAYVVEEEQPDASQLN